jgi:hypothetical protein
MSKRSKKIAREARLERQKSNQLLLTKLIHENKSKSNEELYELSQELVSISKKTIENKVLIKAIESIIDDRHTQRGLTDSSTFQAYPSIYDPEFNKKIALKREFHINKIKEADYSLDLDEQTNKLCKFNLSSNQKFLKTYISSNTPYNGLLLFHGTGVGKTCSSISIAENFKDVLLETNKKITILLNPSIRDNFIKNIFNIERLKQGIPEQQCTKDAYLKEANITPSTNYKHIHAKIMKIINNRYDFYGYGAFSNYIEKMENEISQRYDDEDIIADLFEKKIRETFDNTVMIIDEVHNIKETSDSKVLPKLLKRVLEIVKNMKLILLSATPMFDKPTEIIDILNLLLSNDNRTLLKQSQVFNNGNLTEEGKIILSQKCRGYISYLRGEHPLKFPKRLFADIFEGTKYEKELPIIKHFPSKDINNKDIAEDDRIKLLKIISCPMKTYQLEKYSSINLESSEDDYGAFNQTGLMASNMIFPSESEDEPINKLTGINGFNRLFKKEPKKKYSINPAYADDLLKENIHKYSSKISKIINNIETSQGIVFIYSQFIYAGVLPLALALEKNGYSKYEGSLLHNKSIEEQKKEKKFLIISGDNDVSKDAYAKYLKIENNNQNGDVVKVIIGSSTAAEGLDFKYIREVHVLEPWHHFNKIDQVIGRGIRNCSHKDLDKELRNVVVYLYASTLNVDASKDIETIDLKMYRVSEKKMKQISEVEYVLKTNSVDCNLNIEGNRFTNDYYKQKVTIITSKNTKHEMTLNDIDNSKLCQFKKCDYSCHPDLSKATRTDINTDTFDYTNIPDTIYDIKTIIKDLFKKDNFYTLEQIKIEYVLTYGKENEDMLLYALSDMIKQSESFSNGYGKMGMIQNQEKYYIFKPIYLKNQVVTFADLMRPITKKTRLLDMTDYKYTQGKKDKELIRSDIVKIIFEIDTLKNTKLELFEDKKYNTETKNVLKELFNNIQKTHNLLYDTLVPEKKEKLLVYIIEKSFSGKLLNGIDKTLLKSLDKNLLYLQRDIDDTQDKDRLWGYKIANHDTIKIQKYDSNTFIDPTMNELKSIKKNVNKRIKVESPPALIIGYLEYKAATNSIHLKIRDKSKEGKKGTQIKTGSICGNDGMKKNVITKYIEDTLKDDKYEQVSKAPGKENLCFELEIYLRHHDIINKDGMKWFYNLEETIEREINKKKY